MNLVEHVGAILDIHGCSTNSIQWVGLAGMLSIDWPTFKEKAKDIVISEEGKTISPSFVVMGDSWFIRVTDHFGLTDSELEFIEIPSEGPINSIEDPKIFLDEIPQ